MAALFFGEMRFNPRSPNNADNDQFIMSKGHAAPILYSALYRSKCINNDLTSLRRMHSQLEGHPMPRSLPWVKVATGSLGQGLSVGLGMALASKLEKRSNKTFVLLGDSELAEGSVYEALQLASHLKLNNLIAIADVNRLGQTGPTMLEHDISSYSARFKSFGWTVLTINGHNIKQILSALKTAGKSKKPTMILAKTLKGKGLSIEDKNGWHGKAIPKDQLSRYLNQLPDPEFPQVTIKAPKSKPAKNKKIKLPPINNYKEPAATREAYGRALATLCSANKQVVALDAEVSNSTHSTDVKKHNKSQFIETYIAEQNLIGIALGLSKSGIYPFASTFSAFLTRAHDQIRMAALSDASFTICGSHAGVSIGEDGASQMGLEDISLFRALPNSSVFYPSDPISCEKLTQATTQLPGIKYIRTTRPKTPVIYKKEDKFPVGDFKIVKGSTKDKAVLAGSGITLHEALAAHEFLKSRGVQTAVVDLYCIKPFKEQKFITFLEAHGGRLVVAEDHRKAGGIGEMISSALVKFKSKARMQHLFVQGVPHSASKTQLLGKHKIDSKAIVNAYKSL